MTNISGLGNDLIKWGNPTLDSLVDSKAADAINFFVGFSAVVAVIIIVVSGYMFMTSSGDPERIEKAQKGITAAVVGMIIVFLARVIVGFVLKEVLNK